MMRLSQAGGCTQRRAAWLPGWLLAPCALAAALHAQASCLSLTDPAAREIDEMADRDGHKALALAQQRIAALESAGPAERRSLASLYAATAWTYSQLELDAKARAFAVKGLQLVPDESDPLHLNLAITYAANVYDSPSINAQLSRLSKLRSGTRPGSLPDICLQITLGVLQVRQDRPDLAVLNLTQAYRATQRPDMGAQHVEAASNLASSMRSMGDYTQALTLNQEEIDWHTAHGSTLALSVAHFLRGETLQSMRDYGGAIEELNKARALSEQIGDRQGIAFDQLRICESQIELGQLESARKQCQRALRTFAAAQSIDVVKETESVLARIELAEGHADVAQAMLNRVLAHGGVEMPQRRITPIYALRAQASAALHNWRDAYSDLEEYLRRYSAENDAERIQQAAALRARFENDREIERNASLQRELALARESAQRQREELRWTAIASTAGGLVIALLTYILIASLRHRRQLLRLATQDSLTALPNRRETAERAAAALALAMSEFKPLTLALIDMDRFKSINDRFGHAAGDHVLKEFAQKGREALRAGDLLGRWGGEEFLLVLPDTNLETALVIIERLRLLALEIQPSGLPELRVTISVGLATTAEGVASLDELVARADKALYDAKNDGRDLIRIAEESYRAASTGVRRALRQN